jgi:ornithine cyclodeaminase
MHLTAMGSDLPEKQELEVEVLTRADKVVADHTAECARRGEIHHALESGAFSLDRVFGELGEIAAGQKAGRTSDSEITVADLTGVGIQDAALANYVTSEALRRGIGQSLAI